MKVVYNACFGGFGLSEAALRRAAELGAEWAAKEIAEYADAAESRPEFRLGGMMWESITCGTVPRHDPILVRVVEEMGSAASGLFAKLTVHELQGRLYRISEYDGSESVEEPGTMDWVDAGGAI